MLLRENVGNSFGGFLNCFGGFMNKRELIGIVSRLSEVFRSIIGIVLECHRKIFRVTKYSLGFIMHQNCSSEFI
jgi:hypothetical protein